MNGLNIFGERPPVRAASHGAVECDDVSSGGGDIHCGDERWGDEDSVIADLEQPDQRCRGTSSDPSDVVKTLRSDAGRTTGEGGFGNGAHDHGISHRLAGIGLARDDESAAQAFQNGMCGSHTRPSLAARVAAPRSAIALP